VLVEHEEVFSHSASSRRELLRVQGQIQVCLLEHSAAEDANLCIENNKVAAVPLAIGMNIPSLRAGRASAKNASARVHR
jgi:hypothetical protein